jgi:hypothetical protein
VVGAWSANPQHAVIPDGARWHYMASSDALRKLNQECLQAPKAGVASSNHAGGTSVYVAQRCFVSFGFLGRFGSWSVRGP